MKRKMIRQLPETLTDQNPTNSPLSACRRIINGAAYQKEEGEQKAEGSMPTKMERAEIATIATWIPASLQVLQDNEQLQGQIDTLMSVGVRQKLSAENSYYSRPPVPEMSRELAGRIVAKAESLAARFKHQAVCEMARATRRGLARGMTEQEIDKELGL